MDKEFNNNKNIIGVDETGVGDYFTPLVACAAFVPKNKINELRRLGVDDSKNISNDKIIQIAKKIKPLIIHRVKHLTQSGYNKLTSIGLNANELKFLLHLSAVNDLEEKINDVDLIVIDQFSTKESLDKYYKKLLNLSFDLKEFKSNVKTIEKAESKYIAVAAASILAREFLLTKMDEQNKKWNTVFPLGTNAIVEGFAKKFIKANGKDKLQEVAKISFKTTGKILK